MQIERVGTLVAALLACVWFALGVRQADDTSKAESILPKSGTLSAARSAQAASLLRSAGTLNPDREVDILRGRLALAENDPERAEQILKDVVRDEPMNIEAWFQLVLASPRHPHTAAVALTHIALLEPSLRRAR